MGVGGLAGRDPVERGGGPVGGSSGGAPYGWSSGVGAHYIHVSPWPQRPSEPQRNGAGTHPPRAPPAC